MSTGFFECGTFPSQTQCPVGNLCIKATGDCISENLYLKDKIHNRDIKEWDQNTICNANALSKIQSIMSDKTITNHCDATYSEIIVCQDAFSKGFAFNVKPSDVEKYTSKDACFAFPKS